MASIVLVTVVLAAVPGRAAAASGRTATLSSVVDRVFTPPTTIASDCSHDVADQLRTWLYSLPPGTPSSPVVVRLAPGGCYLVNESLFLRAFTDLVIDGNGATVAQRNPTTESMVLAVGVTPYTGSPFSPFAVPLTLPIAPVVWYFDGGSDITVENLTINGPNTTQSSTSGGGTMVDSGIELDGVQRAMIRNDTIEHVDGDFVTLTGLLDAPSANWNYPTTDVTVLDNTFTMSGRQGITPEYVDRVSITGNTFQGVAATTIDMESDITGGCSCNVAVTGNAFVGPSSFLIAAITGSSVDDFAFTGNTLSAGAQMRVELAPTLASTAITISGNTGADPTTWPYSSIFVGHGPKGDSSGPMTSVEIADNAVPANVGGLSFVYSGQNVTGLAVRDNVLPTTSNLVPLVMDGPLTQGFSCGDQVAVGAEPVDGTCPGGYARPPLPTAPAVPVDGTIPGGSSPPPPAAPAAAGGVPAVSLAATPGGGGYWIAGASGEVLPFGNARFFGSLSGLPLNAPVNHIVATPDGRGYWLVASDGGTFAFGDAGFYGSTGSLRLNAPVVDLAPTTDGRGYWLVASDGGVFSFGDATFRGSMGGARLNRPVLAMTADAATGGYWLVASDGGVFAFGAPFLGSTGSVPLYRPIDGMTATADGEGYWMVASDGGIFAYGDAAFHGSAGGLALKAPVVGMAADTATGGYWLVAADGGVFAFGAPFLGSV